MTTQPIFRYNPETGCLKEQPSIEAPNAWFPFNGGIELRDEINANIQSYNTHLKNLVNYPTDHKEWPDQDLIEGVDFEYKKICHDTSEGCFDSYCFHCSRSKGCDSTDFKAVPTQKTLWIEAFHFYSTGGFEAVKDLFIIKQL